jgi:hydroxymethylpyrimidine pyrophosphatase-like HAD family hydrolase
VVEGDAILRSLVSRAGGSPDGDGLTVFSARLERLGLSMLVLRPAVGKGTGLEAVARRLSVPREETAAVGDWRNDVGMLRWAGTGVAMGNAHPEALAAADAVLPGDSEGDALAEWLEALPGQDGVSHNP